MDEPRVIEGREACAREFEAQYRMGYRLMWPVYDPETGVLTASVLNGQGFGVYNVEMRFGAKYLGPLLRTPVENHTHEPYSAGKPCVEHSIPQQSPPVSILPLGIEMPHRDAIPDGFFDTL